MDGLHDSQTQTVPVREFHNRCQAYQSESLPLHSTPPPSAHLLHIAHMLGEPSVTGLYVFFVLSLEPGLHGHPSRTFSFFKTRFFF